MRQFDQNKFGGRPEPNSVYTGATSSITGFRDFISYASRNRGNILPAWWNADKLKECEEFGRNGGDFSTLKKPITKEGLIAHYSDAMIPAQVRMLAEAIYGSPVAGSGTGAHMRKHLVAAENSDRPASLSVLGI
jgi:splicing suppressor protein 51